MARNNTQTIQTFNEHKLNKPKGHGLVLQGLETAGLFSRSQAASAGCPVDSHSQVNNRVLWPAVPHAGRH